jgi:hypothetical protein
MITTAVENTPAIRDDARDIPFFRIPARLLTRERQHLAKPSRRNTIRTAPGQRH